MTKIPQIGENTKFTLDVKTIGIIISFVVGLSTTYFTLKSDIALAMEEPKPQVDNIEKDVEEIKQMMNKLDQRLYEIQRR